MLSYNPVSIVLVENSFLDAKELITNSIDEEGKGAVKETNKKQTKLVDNQNKDEVEDDSSWKPNMSRTVSGLYPNSVDAILDAAHISFSVLI